MIALYSGDVLDFDTLFTSLSALKLVTSPMLLVLQQIPHFQSAAASLYRIEMYLADREDLEATREGPVRLRSGSDIEMTRVRHRTLRSKVFRTLNAAFGMDRIRTLLHGITLEINEGSFTMIVGKVASGKSVLLQSLVGETVVLSGSVETNGSGISFCAQTPWLRNATLRQNIVGESQFDQSWYDAVIWACGLQRDFKELKNQDAAMIGSHGITLSGGQKNRISLARALYAREKTIIVDDVLSGLDNTTESLVFSRVFGRDGLLRKMNCTTILATHSTHWAPESDRLVILSEGRVVANGAYGDLIASPEFLEAHSLHGLGKNSSSSSDSRKDNGEEDADENQAFPLATAAEIELNDGYDRRSGDLGTLIYYLKAVGKTQVAVYLWLLGLMNAANAVQYIWLKELAKDSDSADSLRKSMGTFTAITIVDVLLVTLGIAHFTLVFCPRSSLSMHAQQLSAFVRAKFSYLVATDVGEITNRFSQDIVLVDNVLPFAWVNTTYGMLLKSRLTAVMILMEHSVFRTAGKLWHSHCCNSTRGGSDSISGRHRVSDSAYLPPHLAPNSSHGPRGQSATMYQFPRDSCWDRDYSSIRLVRRIPEPQQKTARRLASAVLPLAGHTELAQARSEFMVAGLVVVLTGLAVGLRSKIDTGYLGLALVGAVSLHLPHTTSHA